MGFPQPAGAVEYPTAMNSVASDFWREKLPNEGWRVCNLSLDWGAQGGVNKVVHVNAENIGPQRFSKVRAVWVNNLYSSVDVVLLFMDSGFPLTVPAGTQVVLPVITNAMDLYIQAIGAAAGDFTYFGLFNYLPPPIALEKPTFTSVASSALSSLVAGTTPLIGAGINGLVSALSIEIPGATGGGGAGSVTFTIEDGNANILASAAIALASGQQLPPTIILNLTGVTLRYLNGLNLVVTTSGTAITGSAQVFVYHRETTQP